MLGTASSPHLHLTLPVSIRDRAQEALLSSSLPGVLVGSVPLFSFLDNNRKVSQSLHLLKCTIIIYFVTLDCMLQ